MGCGSRDDGAEITAFGHFARHYDSLLHAGAAKGYNRLLTNYGPALIDRALLDALCRCCGVSFYAAIPSNPPGMEPDRPEFGAVALTHFLHSLEQASHIEARHTVGMLDAITAADLTARVGDGLPETLEDVIRTYGHRYFKLKVVGQTCAKPISTSR